MPLTDAEIRERINEGLTDQQIVDYYASNKSTAKDIDPKSFDKVMLDNGYAYEDPVNGGWAGSVHAAIVTNGTAQQKQNWNVFLNRIRTATPIETTKSALTTALLNLAQITGVPSGFLQALNSAAGGLRYNDVNLSYVSDLRASVERADALAVVRAKCDAADEAARTALIAGDTPSNIIAAADAAYAGA